MSAALEFSPNASASTMPAAMAMTFFRPTTSTRTSLEVVGPEERHPIAAGIVDAARRSG